MAITAALVLGTTACTDDSMDTGTVVSITDGDTLVASVNGDKKTILLLNIDTPETNDPQRSVECLGREATDFLGKLLPVGSKITLKYDVERLDKYDRTLAAVYTTADEFVSAEIARAGLGTAVSFGKNTKYLPPVEEAERAAKSAAQGLYDPQLECTLPAQIQTATAALDEAAGAGADPATAAAAGIAIGAAGEPISKAKVLLAELKAGKSSTDLVKWAAFTEAELSQQIQRLSSSVQKTETSVAALETKRDVLAAAEQKAAEEAAAEKAAAEAKAREEAAAAKAAEAAAEYAAELQAQAEAYAAAQAQAEAEAYAAAQAEADAEAERIRNLPPVYVPPAPEPYVPPAPPAGNSGGGYDGYTGPRCYLPGGKSYRPC